ncbi:glycerophosphodiester phosphodiesterase family protein [Chryseolinea sp. T2]|uniref:glycerophosphodiester phosphodiesterase family protein n=1 Tax=Chryseolinea sp. T2 TaxID=3129255 RepID=UPI0030779AD9
MKELFKMRRVAGVVVLLAIGLAAAAQERADVLRKKLLDPNGDVMVAAHRAAHDKYPENSIDAIREAIKLQVDIIEIDVKVSKDGVPFLMHDRTMNRTTNGKGDPEELTWEQLQQYNIVDKGKVTEWKIPSLEMALKAAHGNILVDLDLKTDRIDDVVRVVEKTDMQDYVLFFDSEYSVLQRVKIKNPDFMIMPRAYRITQADSAIAMFDPPVVHIDFDFYTPKTVSVIKGSMARVWINALGEPDQILRDGKAKKALKKVLYNGANIIQTDEPGAFVMTLQKEKIAAHD